MSQDHEKVLLRGKYFYYKVDQILITYGDVHAKCFLIGVRSKLKKKNEYNVALVTWREKMLDGKII